MVSAFQLRCQNQQFQTIKFYVIDCSGESEILIDAENYLLRLSRYIHLNPVVAGIVPDAEDWQYSNYLEWIGMRGGSLIDHEFVAAYFPNPSDYTEFIASSTDDALARQIAKYYPEEG